MRISKHHRELDNTGEGRCSVPMWVNGVPAGFCDCVAYGFPSECETIRGWDGQDLRTDGKYNGYVPGLACANHGGPVAPDDGEGGEGVSKCASCDDTKRVVVIKVGGASSERCPDCCSDSYTISPHPVPATRLAALEAFARRIRRLAGKEEDDEARWDRLIRLSPIRAALARLDEKGD